MDNTNERIAMAPLPTAAELRIRRNVLWQFYRFLRIDLTMFLLARKKHH